MQSNAQSMSTTPTGICIIRGTAFPTTAPQSASFFPKFSDPDLGYGYAKLAKPGINTIAELQTNCSQSDYTNLYSLYCSTADNVVNPATQGVATYDSQGNFVSTSCSSNGCGVFSCPQGTITQSSPTGVCMVRSSSTMTPGFFAPDLGTGYAKLAKPGINTLTGLQSACTQADYNNLMVSYCNANNTSVQQQVVTYDSFGGYTSNACGAFGCNEVSCASLTLSPTPTPKPPTPTLGPLTFSAISVTNISQTSATIKWTTSALGKGYVNYDTTEKTLKLTSSIDQTIATTHTVTLTGLSNNRTYYYRLMFIDAAGKSNFGPTQSFKTLR